MTGAQPASNLKEAEKNTISQGLYYFLRLLILQIKFCPKGGQFSGPPCQGRREKFRAPGQKFRLSLLISGAPKSRDEQKNGHSLRKCSNFGTTSSDEQNKLITSADVRISARNKKKKTSSRLQAEYSLS